MKIAILLRSLNASGGMERQALELARSLLSRGHDVKFYTFSWNREICYPELTSGISIVSPKDAESLLKDNFRHEKLVRLIDEDTEIVNPHDLDSLMSASLFARTKNIPTVLMLNDLTLASWNPYITPDEPNRVGFFKKTYYKIKDLFFIMKYLHPLAVITCINSRTAKEVKKRIGVEAVVVGSGTDVDKFLFFPHEISDGKKIKLLCHGILFPHRKYETAIEAVSILRKKGIDATLDIVGDTGVKGSSIVYFERLKKFVSEKGVSGAVNFQGRVSDDDLKRLHKDSDFLVFASHIHWGIAAFEAMSSGLPVVVSDISGVAETLGDRFSPLFFEYGNPRSLSDVIENNMADKLRYAEFSKLGADFVRENYTWSKYCEKMEAVFRMVIKT